MSLSPLQWGKNALNIALKIRDLSQAQEKQAKVITVLAEKIQALELEVIRLRAREELVIAEAKAAAAAASTTVVVSTVSDISGRLGRMEGQMQMFRLPPPA
jgi:hypothetical protein